MSRTFTKLGTKWCGACSILLAASIAVPALGQPAPHVASISGTVRTAAGQGLSRVTVVLSRQETQAQVQSVLTDTHGQYAFSKVAYGIYELEAKTPGYIASRKEDLSFASDAVTADFILLPVGSGDEAFTESTANPGAPPSFSVSEVQGSVAPSGYSTASTAEESSQVMDHVIGLDPAASSATAGGGELDFARRRELENALIANPDSFEANRDLGVFYLQEKNFAESIHSLERAEKIKPEDTDTTRNLALAYLGARKYSQAIALLERLLRRNPKQSAAARLLATAYARSDEKQSSIEEYKLAAGLDNGEPNMFYCGIGLIQAGAIDDAGKLLASALVNYPRSARLWVVLSTTQNLQRHPRDAIRSLVRATDLDPAYAPAYALLASLAGDSPRNSPGDVRQILNRLRLFLDAHPDSAEAQYDYALGLWKEQRANAGARSTPEIEAHLRLAIEKNPMLYQAHFQLGVVYAEAGNYGEAVRELREAVLLKPSDAEARYRLAQAYRRNGQPQAADRELRAFEVMHKRD